MGDLERLTVEQWLKSIHFGEYCTKFEEAGYDDLSFLVRLTDAEVNEMQMSVQMTKGGHRLSTPFNVCNVYKCLYV